MNDWNWQKNYHRVNKRMQQRIIVGNTEAAASTACQHRVVCGLQNALNKRWSLRLNAQDVCCRFYPTSSRDVSCETWMKRAISSNSRWKSIESKSDQQKTCEHFSVTLLASRDRSEASWVESKAEFSNLSNQLRWHFESLVLLRLACIRRHLQSQFKRWQLNFSDQSMNQSSILFSFLFYRPCKWWMFGCRATWKSR